MKKVVAVLGVLFVCFGILGLGATASAATTKDSLLDMDYLQQYVERKGDTIYFNLDKAQENNESDQIIEVGEIFNEFSRVDDNTAEGKKLVLRAISIPVYGNYCGPGTNFDSAGNPIDQLDKYCMYHDLCYGANGWGNKQCDITLVTNLTTGLRNGTIKGVRAKTVANAAILYFANKG